MEVTQATFARMAGVSRASVCGKIKNKTLILNSANRLDTDNPVNREYLNKHQGKTSDAFLSGNGKFFLNPAPSPSIKNIPAAATAPTDTSAPASASPAPRRIHTASPAALPEIAIAESAGIPEYMLGLTIRELITQYGTAQGIERYVKILRDLTAADEKDQKMRERRTILISKDFVTSHIFSLLEQMINKLLDMPERIVDNLIALAAANAGENRQQIINTMRDDISIIITDTKDLIIRQLESLKGKHDETPQDALQEIKEQMSELAENRSD